jgi:hypothetical protein
LSAIDSLSAELDRALEHESRGGQTPVISFAPPIRTGSNGDTVVHSFDTADGDLARSGYVLELHECPAALLVVAGRANADDVSRSQVQIDGSWALQVLSGDVSPLVILDRRLGRPGPAVLQEIRSIVGKRRLCRIDSRVTNRSTPAAREHITPDEFRAAAG